MSELRKTALPTAVSERSNLLKFTADVITIDTVENMFSRFASEMCEYLAVCSSDRYDIGQAIKSFDELKAVKNTFLNSFALADMRADVKKRELLDAELSPSKEIKQE